MRTSNLWLLPIVVVLPSFGSIAQPISSSTAMNRAAPATGMVILGENGQRTPVGLTKPLKLDFEAAKSGESLLDIAKRKRYATDPATISALQRWNPKVTSPSDPLPAGDWINFVRPDVSVMSGAKLAVSKDSVPLTPLVFRSNRADIEFASRKLLQLKVASQVSAAQYRQFQSTADKLQKANLRFEEAATAMSSRQRALAAIQINAATSQLTSVAVRSWASNPATALAIQGSASLADDAEAFSQELAEQPRKLKILVRPTAAGSMTEYGVYVLPLTLVTYGAAAEVPQLRNLLGALSFDKPTSPSLGDVEAGVKYAVWFGPKSSFELMANLVKNGQVRKYVTVDARARVLDDVSFDESDQTKAP